MRPGIMLYFDLLRPIKKLSDEDKGKLLVAMLEYGQDGVVPEFEGALDMAWEFVKPKLDKDAETYELSCEQREYANFCKSRKKLGLPKIPIEQWKAATENEMQQWVTEDNEPLRADTEPLRSGNFGAFRNPTTTTSTTTNTTTSTTTAAAATATTEDEDATTATEDESKVVRAVGGTLGKGVVFMSDEQVSDLLERMGIETFDYYVDKLSDFIIKNGARVKSHYETILKWWKEDSSLR